MKETNTMPKIDFARHLLVLGVVGCCIGIIRGKMALQLDSVLGKGFSSVLEGFISVGLIFMAVAVIDDSIRRGKPEWFVKWITKQ
jgi:hypothetical protein